MLILENTYRAVNIALVNELKMDSQQLTPSYLAGQDCVVISTDHSSYDYDFIVNHAKLVLDTRNATKNVKEGRHKIRKA